MTRQRFAILISFVILILGFLMYQEGRAEGQLPFVVWSDPPGKFTVVAGDRVTWYYTFGDLDADEIWIETAGPRSGDGVWDKYQVLGITSSDLKPCCEVGWYGWIKPVPPVISYTLEITGEFPSQFVDQRVAIKKYGVYMDFHYDEYWTYRRSIYLPLVLK